ncbi:unnamed protein product, partial [marine sediment metagenome]
YICYLNYIKAKSSIYKAQGTSNISIDFWYKSPYLNSSIFMGLIFLKLTI